MVTVILKFISVLVNKRPMGPVSLTHFHLQNCLKVFAIPDFILITLNLLAPRIFHAKYHCIPVSGSWEDFWRLIKTFFYFAPYWASKGASPFIWTNLNPHPTSMFPAKFGWNWPSGSWEDILIISLYITM